MHLARRRYQDRLQYFKDHVSSVDLYQVFVISKLPNVFLRNAYLCFWQFIKFMCHYNIYNIICKNVYYTWKKLTINLIKLYWESYCLSCG